MTGLLSAIHIGNNYSYVHYRVQTDCEPHCVPPEILSPIKRQKAEADNSVPYGNEVKNAHKYTPYTACRHV